MGRPDYEKNRFWLKYLYILTLCYVFVCVGVGVYTQHKVQNEQTIVETNLKRNCKHVLRNGVHLYLADVMSSDGKVYETENIKLTSYTDTAETSTAVAYVQKHLTERQKVAAQMTDATVYCEALPENACIGYYKYYTKTICGNAEYTTPVVTVVYAKETGTGLLKHIITTVGKTYDADVQEQVLADFLYSVDVTTMTAFDLLSYKDVTGTYIPRAEFAYTAPEYFEFDSTTGTLLEYRINDKGAPIDVYVPETIGGVTVRHIADKAFYKYKDTDTILRSVVLPSTVTTIGAYAFAGCSDLESVVLSTNLDSIGEYALSGCTALKEVVLPESLKELPAGCFYGDTALETVSGTVAVYTETTFARCDNLTQLPEISDVAQ